MSVTESNDRRLRECFATLAETAQSGEICPSTEQLLKSVREEFDAESNEAIVLHLSACAACATAWRLGRELAAGESAMQRHGVMTLFSRGRWLPLAAAAALVIGVVGLGIYFVPDRPRSGPTYRADEGDWIRPAFPSDQLLPRGLCTLRWTLGPEGTTYDVVVTTQDLDPLARGWRLETPEFTVSAELLRDLPAAARIHWRVTAYLLDGRRVTSNTFTTLIE